MAMGMGGTGGVGPAGAAGQSRGAREALAGGLRGDARASQYDSRTRNPRYDQRLVASGPMSLHNMMQLGKMMPGPGMALKAGLGMMGSSLGPNFEGVTPRSATGYDYDSPNRLGSGQRSLLGNALRGWGGRR